MCAHFMLDIGAQPCNGNFSHRHRRVAAGRMSSQKMYDVPGGLQLSLPIADYQSHHGGRIEGKGVRPDVEAEASQALSRALELAAAP